MCHLEISERPTKIMSDMKITKISKKIYTHHAEGKSSAESIGSIQNIMTVSSFRECFAMAGGARGERK